MQWAHEPKIIIAILSSLLLMPINWGIESYKWKLITSQVESISFKTSAKSIFSGICLGNIAPGRAMEFIGKIFFFKLENKPSVTILHFINGMFQMLITLVVGVCAIAYKFSGSYQSSNLMYTIIIGGIFLVLIFCFAIFNIEFIQRKLKFIKWFKINPSSQALHFSKTLVIKLFALSVIRYIVFSSQFYFIYTSLSLPLNLLDVTTSIAAYFMLTSVIPMVSFIEPAIRAAIALFVFNNAFDNSISVILSSTLLWVINVVLPSAIGYVIILKEKINFKS